jgi:hypothetical protein
MVDTQSPSWLSEFWTPGKKKVEFVEQFIAVQMEQILAIP